MAPREPAADHRRAATAVVAAAVALACAAVAPPAAAATAWKPVGVAADGAPRVAYDPARVRFEPPYVTTWTRVQLPDAATLGNGVRYRSVQQKIAVDCKARTWGVTHSDFYAGADAAGAPAYSDSVARDEWELRPAREGSTGDALIRALCTTPRPW